MRVFALLIALVLGLAGPAAVAQDAPAGAPIAEDGPAYRIGKLNLVYLHRGHSQLPKRDRLMRLEVELGRTTDGYVAPREGVPTVRLRLSDVEEGDPQRFHASALQAILRRIYGFFTDRGLIGVYVAPDPEQIDAAGQDLRPERRTALRILITTGIVTEIRTLASGDRIDRAERVNHPLHAPLIARSPLQPWVEGAGARSDLLDRGDLDDFLFRLSRHPGRHVDAAIAAGDVPGGVTLDYLVSESRPLSLYAQLSNTGTPSTDRFRQRFGLVHSQLTNHDDVLSIDYTTASFDEVNAVNASYEVPLPFSPERYRFRVYGGWSEYTAAELGVFADIFTGKSWTAGGEVIANVFQDRDLFVDVVVGGQRDYISVTNELLGINGEEHFNLVHFGVRLEQQSRWYSVLGSVTAEWNDGQDPTPGIGEITRLGRLFPSQDFGTLRWDVSASAYLEPLLDRAAWNDVATPESSTLAHEVSLSFRGQYAFDNRLIPQYQQVLGGLATVRGYPQSVIAGDTVLIGRAEYRYHLPRAMAIQPTPAELFGEPFRVAPQNVYGRTDWDLVFRGFLDVGHAIVNDPLFFESDETLLGTGVGVELQYRRLLNLRVDWGVALSDLDREDVSAGSSQWYFVASFSF